MQLEQEVQNDLRKKDLASGNRHTAAVAYDDVADEVEEDDGPPDAPSSPESAGHRVHCCSLQRDSGREWRTSGS